MPYYNQNDSYKPMGFGGFSFFPPVIKNLLILNVVIFILDKLILTNIAFNGATGGYWITRFFALNPLSGADYYGQPYNFQIWQLVTYQFLHGDITHIFFNMFALWMFGVEIENIWGSKRFLTFYLTCGIGAGLLHIFLTPVIAGTLAPTIGASGAVYGVLIAFAMMFPDRYIFIYFLLPVKAKYLIAFYIIFEFLSVGSGGYVAHLAHLGGALFGFILVLYYRKSTFNVGKIFSSFKKQQRPSFRSPKHYNQGRHVEDADYYDINATREENKVTQAEIDAILDKISQSGYKSLNDREKRILFEASKKG